MMKKFKREDVVVDKTGVNGEDVFLTIPGRSTREFTLNHQKLTIRNCGPAKIFVSVRGE